MGTNYYAHSVCETCGNSSSRTHIGKSSAGWVFTLHRNEERALTTLGQWVDYLDRPGVKIYNEYDEQVSLAEFIKTVTERGQERHRLNRISPEDGRTWEVEDRDFT